MIKSTTTDDPAQNPPTEPSPSRGGSHADDGGSSESNREPNPQDDGHSPEGRRWTTRGVLLLVGLFAAVLIVSLVIGISLHLKKKHNLSSETAAKADAPPRVQVARAREGSVRSVEALPGNAEAFFETAIYGRANGYLSRLLVDIGDPVKSGDLLAQISAPEIDAQLDQAKAMLEQSKATLESNKASEIFSKADLGRYTQLRRPGAATEQDYENRLMTERTNVATIHATEATIDSNAANVKRLAALQSYQKLLAPYDGVITARNVNPGDLITADNPSTERQLFRIAKIDPLRVFVDVPQSLSTTIRVGQDAILFRQEEPQRQYHGKVARSANALDPSTRTLRTEVDVPNRTGALFPGMYLHVKFVVSRESVPLLVPTDSVIVRTETPKVAIVDHENRIRYRTVQLGRDYGKTIEVITGLKKGEPVAVHPGDDLAEGIKVQPIDSPQGQPDPAAEKGPRDEKQQHLNEKNVGRGEEDRGQKEENAPQSGEKPNDKKEANGNKQDQSDKGPTTQKNQQNSSEKSNE